MAGIVLEKGKTIYSYGQPMTALHLITNGKVDVSYPGGSYTLGKGDVISICEICSEIHLLGYTTLEDTTILTYPLTSLDSLNDILQKHPDVARLFCLSCFRQINILLNRSSISELYLETPRVAASERGPMAKPSSGHTRQGFRRRGCRAAHPGAAAPGRRSGWGAERHGRAGRSG